jgi:large subunit ribosomal protein L2
MKSYKPTTPSRRHMTVADYSGLSKVEPWRPLTKSLPERAGRNNDGRITMRHQGGGVKRLYREIDFGQNNLNVQGRVETLEYDPYRTAFIARIVYKNGARAYVLAPEKLKVGDEIIAAEKAPLTLGNRMQLQNMPLGTQVYNVEMQENGGGKLARSAGSYVEILAHEDGFTNLKLTSGAIRRVSSRGYASLGQVSNSEHNLVTIGKAGRSRWMGIRPTVRGSVMNPVDHPYGGGEGRQKRGTKRPKTMWGKVTGGRKTRDPKKWSNVHIIQRRPKGTH